MAIWTFGSINVDHFYRVPHVPAPGETIAAGTYDRGLGGKGANQSVAAAMAGANVQHIGSVGEDSAWIFERLASFGVETRHVAIVDAPTGHAIITVGADGENAIVILAGANAEQSLSRLEAALAGAGAGDIFLMQNETTLQPEAARLAAQKGLRVFYSAAPFSADQTMRVMPFCDTLLLNEVEAEQLEKSAGRSLFALDVPHIAVTLGARGARWIDTRSGDSFEVESIVVDAIDTTGAGDTFAGYLAAAFDKGLSASEAMSLAASAAALKVTKKGTADAIPSLAEVEAFVAVRR